MAMMSDQEYDAIDETDRAALILAINETLKEPDQNRVEQVRGMLDDPQRPWSETARFCSYHGQMQALRLRPWEEPPCYPDDPEYMEQVRRSHIGAEAVALIRRMLKLGISRYHPDPMMALAAAEREEAK